MKDIKQIPKEEIQKAEEMMDRREAKISQMREEVWISTGEEMLENLKKGEYNLSISERGTYQDINVAMLGSYGSYVGISMYGMIGGRRVYFSFFSGTEVYASTIDGKIDSKFVSEDNIIKLFKKYMNVAKLQCTEFFDRRAKKEILEEDIAEKKRLEKERIETDPEYRKEVEEREQWYKQRKIEEDWSEAIRWNVQITEDKKREEESRIYQEELTKGL